MERKLISPWPDHPGEFQGEDPDLCCQTLIENPQKMDCDICTQPGVTYEFPCAEFDAIETDKETWGSTGSWMACNECALLIEKRDIDGMVTRATATALKNDPKLKAIHVAALDIMLRALYEQFFIRRAGAGRRV
jgi:hypothetical protein